MLSYFLPISKQEFCISKINNIDYKENIGNFCKHLKKNNISYVDYVNKYYFEYLPKSLETGNVIFNKGKGYWNLCFLLEKEYKPLQRKVLYIINVIDRIKTTEPQYFTKYLTFEYWLNQNYKLSEAYEKINFFINGNRDVNYYKFLSDYYYDRSWSLKCKIEYQSNILKMNYIQLKRPKDRLGIYQRTNDIYAIKLPDILKTARLDYRSTSVRCIEYWLRKGYNLNDSIEKVSEIQRNNTLDNISKRYRCSLEEAKHIQKEIYSRRLITIKSKSADELKMMYKKQDSGSFEYCLRKTNFNYNKAKKLYNDLKKKKTSFVPFGKASKESLKLFIPLYKYLRKNGILREDIYLGLSGSQEYVITNINKNLLFRYDFTILSYKLIIEYDGVYWHKDTNERDKLKTEVANQDGFKLLRISSDLDENEKIRLIKLFIDENIQITNTNW